jgi:hypothetical protein
MYAVDDGRSCSNHFKVSGLLEEDHFQMTLQVGNASISKQITIVMKKMSCYLVMMVERHFLSLWRYQQN